MATKAASAPQLHRQRGRRNRKLRGSLRSGGAPQAQGRAGRFRGRMQRQGWKPGRAVTEEEFLAAVKNFENAPMNGAHTTKESEARR